MKILFVHDIGQKRGGAETLILHERRLLEASGHEVKVLTSCTPTPDTDFADYTFRSPDATSIGKLLLYVHNPFAKRALKKAVKSFRPDVIHLHTITKASPAIAKATQGIPTVMTLHDYGLLYPELANVLPREQFCGFGNEACCPEHVGFVHFYFERHRTKMHRTNFSRYQNLLVPSQFMARILADLGMKATTLSNGVPVIDGSSAEKSKNLILYVGRLEPEKGIMELLMSFPQVVKVAPRARLMIVGNGSLLPDVKQFITDRKLEKSIEIYGQAPAAEVEALYQKATIVVVPSLWPEPFGLVGLEAMSAGAAVVGSGRGGMQDWLQDGYNGLIADPADPNEFAAVITKLLTDDTLRQRLIRNGDKTAQTFSLENHVRRLENIYLAAKPTAFGAQVYSKAQDILLQ